VAELTVSPTEVTEFKLLKMTGAASHSAAFHLTLTPAKCPYTVTKFQAKLNQRGVKHTGWKCVISTTIAVYLGNGKMDQWITYML